MAAPKITQSLIPVGRKNRPGYKLTPKYITIHDTANPGKGADAAAHASYFKGATAAAIPASVHFVVDGGTLDGKKAPAIYQLLPLNENGWHAGDGANGPGNRQSIGIEICENKDGDRAQAEANAAWLTAKLLKDYGLGLDRVKQHYDWSGKNCPRVLRGRKGGWQGFLLKVEGCLKPEALTPIMGAAVASKDQARSWLQKKAPDWINMADLYYAIAPKYNIRADVALAQSCKETGFYRFGGLVKPEQNNFCGLGATGPGNPGHSFPDRATGVEAHIQHLYAYATTEALPKDTVLVDPRFNLVRRGTAPYVEYLGAAENSAGVGWAYPGHDYGKSIVRDYLAGLLGTEAPSEEGETELERLRKENQELRKKIEDAKQRLESAKRALD